MPRALLHTCCGPCAGHAVEELRRRGYDVTFCFANANLSPPEEYARRLEAARRLAGRLGAPLIADPPDHGAWRTEMVGLEAEPEGGARCRRCFAHALRRVRALAVAGGFDAFTTTLTVSPHKSAAVIHALGREIDPERFLPLDFKQRDGFRRSADLARECGLYRQDYCGCEFSLTGRDVRKAKPRRPAAAAATISPPA